MFRGPSIPFYRFRAIRIYTLSMLIHERQIILGVRMSLLRGDSIPFYCFLIVAVYPGSNIIEDSQIELRG